MTTEFPAPTTISLEAQKILATVAARPPQPDPAPADLDVWRALAAAAESSDPVFVETMARATTGAVTSDVAVAVEAGEIHGAKFFAAEPSGIATDDERALLYIHGGGFLWGGGPTARRSTELIAGNIGVRTWGMDYRQLPENPFPAGLDDCLMVYRELLKTHRPEMIAVAGQSGGASLAAALLLRARDEGLPLPGAACLISPCVDFTQAGDTYTTLGFALPNGWDPTNTLDLYRGETPLEHPYISPLFGTFTADFPPVMLTSGTRDFLLSDTVRLHRKLLQAGVRAELHVWEGALHGMFMGQAPEDREQIEQARRFLEACWAAA
ncbi:alpha/beta hydrolase fold domain-containing protein [Paenarthrobacter nitroguajacolicus]|uniref:alpha/beta hydrolase fold domain-containing protein n=1 Tax=Paenarthrobacter nitroguajacolicus TaxID=211146 RepID=UPI00285FA2CE|nr:alpha/beta hydrolase fold domain-containing protein [Paenarthrobacter nitroguajacolicus]MDR6639553.1 acetyl esterase/lipase [Paenarthrobacter nitroguajacolicus]